MWFWIADSSNYKSLDLYIDFQEKVYGTDR